jgi:hypothetical protein
VNHSPRRTALGLLLALSVSGCVSDRPKTIAIVNESASLTGEIPSNPLRWKVITSEMSAADLTQATLFGNDVAVRYARTSTQHDYPNGAILALVTWMQQEDPRWFGAKIPSQARSVEFVYVGEPKDGKPTYSYEKYEGTPLKKRGVPETILNDRAQYLMQQRAAVMP